MPQYVVVCQATHDRLYFNVKSPHAQRFLDGRTRGGIVGDPTSLTMPIYMGFIGAFDVTIHKILLV